MFCPADLKVCDTPTLAAALTHGDSGLHYALQVADYVHAGQQRKVLRPGARALDPYLIHPLRVTLRLVRLTGNTDPAVLSAALLHDSVEDAPQRVLDRLAPAAGGSGDLRSRALTAIAAVFSERTATLVQSLSNPGKLSHEQYRRHLTEHVFVDSDALAIKACDLIDNAGSLKYDPDPARRARLAAKYAAPVAGAVARAREISGPALVQRLTSVSTELEQILATA